MAIKPTADQIRALRDSPLEGPVVMLNLLRYPPRSASGEDAAVAEHDNATFRRYGRSVQESLEAVGARVLWQGTVDSVVIGDDEADGWHEAILVEYPSRAAFLEMTSTPRYGEVSKDRSAGLADSRLLAMTERHRAH